jgi:tetratricopeptide (TPR) repeat protein
MNRILLVSLFLLVIAACTTQKRRGDLSPMSKFYHNTTAKYNGYFNANEIMALTLARMEQQHQDNYTQLLNVYPYLANENPQAIAPQMDTAIKKVSVVVNLHRYSHWTDDCYLLVGKAQFLKQDFESAEATFRYAVNEFNPDNPKKPIRKNPAATQKAREQERKIVTKEREKTAKEKKKEQDRARKDRAKRMKQARKERERYNKAVQQARKKGVKPPPRPSSASRNKQEEQNKEQPTETPVKEAPKKEDDKNKPKQDNKKKDNKKKDADKPEDKKPDNYFMKHRPAYQECVLWLSKAYIERNNFDAAQRLINQLIENPNTFPDVYAELAPLQAHLYIRQKKYDLAIQPLEQAVQLASRRKDKARYSYILAQLYQRYNRSDAAYAAFERVLKYSNDFELEFNAKLSMAQNAWASGRGGAQDARQNLEKMLRDDKNADFKDQIYHAIANIALQAGDRAAAIENLELALRSGGSNNAQRTETNLLLAQLYFEDEKYVPAKRYYESALETMQQKDERYNATRRLSENLTDIAKNLEIIALQDSLLRISDMSDDERKALATDIKKRQEAERAAALAAANSEVPGKGDKGKLATTETRTMAPGTAPALQKPSSFFAYDERALRQGKRDFQRKWGNRPLEDNWRRSGRSSNTSDDGAQQENSLSPVASITDEEMNNIFRGIPQTEDEKKVAHYKVREAMFALGSLYRERLENNEKAAEILEELNRRYPANNFELDSWYYLYLTYTDLNNKPKAREFADKIIAKYPQTSYGRLLQDPGYIAEIQDEKRRLNQYYSEAYAAFTGGSYQMAYDMSQQSREKFGATNPLQPKFALLSAMCVGNLKGKEDYVAALSEVVAKYPNTEEQKYAREALRLLGALGSTLPGDQKVADAAQFEINDDQVHSIIIALSDIASLNDAKNMVSDFNRKYFDLDKLRISDVFLINGEVRTPLIVVRRFKDKADAMRYYNAVIKNKKDFISDKYRHETYAISQSNYGKLFSSVKSVEAYRVFFENHYR